MVKKILRETINLDEYLDSVIDEVTDTGEKEYLKSIKDRLKVKFLDYHGHKGISRSIGSPIILRQSSKDILLKLYDSSTKTAKKLKNKIRATGRSLDSCPYCGDISRPTYLDHYLPQKIYYEFTVHPYNLVPSCFLCNSKKRAKIIDQDGENLFVHPYYWRHLDLQVFEIKLNENYSFPIVIIRPSSTLSHGTKRLIASHIESLDMRTRFSEYFIGRHKKMKLLGKLYFYKNEKRNFKKIFQNAYDTNLLLKGKNCWETLFFQFVLNNEEYFNYLYSSASNEMSLRLKKL